MKKLILSVATIAISIGANFAQTYQNDFQKVIGLERQGIVNYTLCETADKGYAMVSFIERGNGMHQNRIQVFKTDANLNIVSKQAFDYNTAGLMQFEITPFDLYETKDKGFIIAGGLINEGDPSQSGGFLLSLKHEKNQLVFNWMQIYPNDNQSKFMPIQEIRRVVQMDDGYMTIARGKDALTSGLVMKTDLSGEVKWTKHFFGTEYKGNRNSDIADIVKVDGEQVAVVGNVNGFPNDDADIQLIRLTTNGELLSHHIYEYQGEVKDPKYTYLERAAAIEYNPEKKEFIIAGTVTKKVEGVCTTAEYKDVLTFAVDFSTEKVMWSTRHDIGADRTFNLESFFCADIDYGKEGYAVAGTVQNRLNTKTTHYNGFILRLNKEAKSTNVRYYGAQNQDFLSRIYNKSVNTYVAGGMFNKSGTNMNWLIESFQTVKGDCLSKRSEPKTTEHPLTLVNGEYRKVNVTQRGATIKPSKSAYFEAALCGKKTASGSFSPTKEQIKAVKSL